MYGLREEPPMSTEETLEAEYSAVERASRECICPDCFEVCYYREPWRCPKCGADIRDEPIIR